jgi:hypothetical protein
MMSALIFILYSSVCFLEILYIIFRNQGFHRAGFYIFPVTLVLSLKQAYLNLSYLNIAGVTVSLLVLIAYIFLKSKPYEKPDYRYLIILAGVTVFSFFK